ncbi:hypothetical protein GGR57DRAFT_365181 [Xylariaceae sp. FL1272]|nr:hypothetical protein GGR57DRAFT_365181 [Xylariaceae sp. FL1272]
MADSADSTVGSHQPEERGRMVASTGEPVDAPKPKRIPPHQLYAQPAPVRTFPLPTFYPSNPLSLFHVLWVWAKQVVAPPTEPSVIHQGIWSPETRSVHVQDPQSIRALWEQGFFGKGTYSRSEPNWLKREQNRQSGMNLFVAEEHTLSLREERKRVKWARAKKEQEAITRTRMAEAFVAPVGPKELLALPNSIKDIVLPVLSKPPSGTLTPDESDSGGVVEDVDAPISSTHSPSTVEGDLPGRLGRKTGSGQVHVHVLDGAHPLTPPKSPSRTSSASPTIASALPKRRKSVRFSPKVESTTFQFSDPPSPHLGSVANGRVSNDSLSNGTLNLPSSTTGTTEPTNLGVTVEIPEKNPPEIKDREHLQLSLEEAFYLAYSLGVLTVLDPATSLPMTTQALFEQCRQLSYYPRRSAELQPDDPFLMQYAVYHHFRSLGWVARSGIKFGADWLLYLGGPVFTHAEFAVVVIPTYSDPYWKTQGHGVPERSWHSLHSIGRVQSHALKTLVLAYVDIPAPTDASDPTTMLKRYKVREFFMKRFLSNRNR